MNTSSKRTENRGEEIAKEVTQEMFPEVWDTRQAAQWEEHPESCRVWPLDSNDTGRKEIEQCLKNAKGKGFSTDFWTFFVCFIFFWPDDQAQSTK